MGRNRKKPVENVEEGNAEESRDYGQEEVEKDG